MMIATECIFCGAAGPFDPHLIDPVCYACLTADLLSRYAAACDALDFAHSEGFEWPVDPFSSTAIAFADPETAWDHIAPPPTNRRSS